MASESSNSSTKFRPLLNDNTIAIKIYSPLGEVAVGNYAKLHQDINYNLSHDCGCSYDTILYAQSGVGAAGSIYMQYANNSLGPANAGDTKTIVLIEYFCPGAKGEELSFVRSIHNTICKALDPNDIGLFKIVYMIMYNVNMVALDPPLNPADDNLPTILPCDDHK